MARLVKESIKDQVYNIIKEKIMNQTYKLGEKVNILSLSDELNVSNTPIREALSRLESEGLVIFTPNAGQRVIELNNLVYKEVCDTVTALILGGYELCRTAGITDKLAEQMEKILNIQKQMADNSCSDFEYARISIDFDITILNILENRTLSNLYNQMFNVFYLIVLYEQQNCESDRNNSVKEHFEILQAIKEGRHDDVKRLIQLHYTKTINFE